jgi:hypothetical protein
MRAEIAAFIEPPTEVTLDEKRSSTENVPRVTLTQGLNSSQL